ncbi:hypothetical protein KIPB_016291, partial [Kipferlia bialata]
VYAATVSPFNY